MAEQLREQERYDQERQGERSAAGSQSARDGQRGESSARRAGKDGQETQEQKPAKEGDSGNEADSEETQSTKDERGFFEKHPKAKPALGIFVILVLVGGGLWYLHHRHWQSTDDAQVDGNLFSISSRINGTVVKVAVLPLVGVLVPKVDARYLIAFGMFISAVGLFTMSNFTLTLDFRTAVYWRMLQSAGLAFLFVPINTISYTGVPQEQNNQVSGMINVMRNIGGSVGISFITTFIARRTQFHQSRLVEDIYGSNPKLHQMLRGLIQHFSGPGGSSSSHATEQAYGRIVGMLQQQAALLSYVDTVHVLGIAALCAIPIIFIAKRTKPGRPAMGH